MKWTSLLLPLGIVFLLQLFLTELLSINTVRPDFIIIFILYSAIKLGPFPAILMGFGLGLLVDMAGVGSYFGLSSLSYSITAYLAGFLTGKYARWIPFYFHLAWVGILGAHFLIYTFIRYQTIFDTDPLLFFGKWVFITAYTLVFTLLFQFIYPLKQVSYAQG